MMKFLSILSMFLGTQFFSVTAGTISLGDWAEITVPPHFRTGEVFPVKVDLRKVDAPTRLVLTANWKTPERVFKGFLQNLGVNEPVKVPGVHTFQVRINAEKAELGSVSLTAYLSPDGSWENHSVVGAADIPLRVADASPGEPVNSDQVKVEQPSSLPDGRNGFSRWKRYPQNKGFFPIGVWLQKPALAGRYKELGVNFYYGLWRGPAAEQIEALRRHGMGVICDFNEYAKEHLLDDPVIWGWMHGDEPDLAHHYPRAMLKGPGGKQVIRKHWPEIYAELDLDNEEYNGWGLGLHPVNDVQADYREIKKHDQSRPVMLQLSKAVAHQGRGKGRGDRNGKIWEYPLYIDGSDAVSFDVYPVAYGTADQLWRIPDGMDQMAEWGSGDRPRMAIIECGFGEKWADKHQQRAQVWMAINHGAAGIAWFVHRWVEVEGEKTLYSDRMPLRHPEIGQAMKELNMEIHKLAPVINSEITDGVVGAEGVALDLGARRKDGELYVFAVERGGRKGSAKLSLSGVEDARVEVIGEDRRLVCRDGSFEDGFDAWGVHLYRILPGDSP